MTGATLQKQLQHDFQVLVDPRGQYKVVADKQVWLHSSPTFFTVDHKLHSSSDGSLKLLRVSRSSGFDKLGPWNVTSLYYQPLGSKAKLKIMFRWYRDLPLVLFGQVSILNIVTRHRN